MVRPIYRGLIRAWLSDYKLPCGSSGGLAVAVAADFLPLAFSSATQGSIMCLAFFTALYALKSSTGLTSRHGLLSSSITFNASGMLGKSAWYFASLLTAVAGYDTQDPVTLEALAYKSHDYTINLASEWSDLRLKIADRKWFWSLYDHQVDDLEERERLNHFISTIAQMRDLWPQLSCSNNTCPA